MNLQDKIVIVTGGGSGIGRSMCKIFAGKGAKVVIADINAAGAEETLAEITGEHVAQPLDVTNPDSWTALREQVLAKYGRIDVLCNNAGVTKLGNVGDFLLQEYYLQNKINIDGVVLGCYTFAIDFKKQGSGFVLNTASIAGLIAVGGVSTYSASKFAVVGFSMSFAAEMAEHGVQVSILCPSVVDTPMNHDLEFPGDEEATMMSPEEVASCGINAIEASDGSLYVFTDPDYLGFVEETLSLPVKEFKAFVKAK